MKRLLRAMMMITGGLAAVPLPGCAQAACGPVVVRAEVEAAPGELSLADLLAPGTCPQVYREAAQVSLGTVPRAGSVRVLEGREIRRLMEGFGELEQNLASGGSQRIPERSIPERIIPEPIIPERILVRQARAVKTCAEIAEFLSSAGRSPGGAAGNRWREDLDCAASGNIPQDAPLELLKASWNVGLERWEFGLRCGRPADCIPFLVWSREKISPDVFPQSFPGRPETASADASPMARLIRTGQTVMLTWEQAGLRIVLPVTCLEAGGLGQFVRVRFKNAPGTLRAEVVGAGSVRASL
ncbi:MAG: flagella basal body P-ring formation protein FlgA [Candidatus Sulfotelmatobacter sp.]